MPSQPPPKTVAQTQFSGYVEIESPSLKKELEGLAKANKATMRLNRADFGSQYHQVIRAFWDKNSLTVKKLYLYIQQKVGENFINTPDQETDKRAIEVWRNTKPANLNVKWETWQPGWDAWKAANSDFFSKDPNAASA